MSKRRVLLCSPIQGLVSTAYMKFVLDVMTTQSPDIEFLYSTVEGGAVSTARTHLAHFAMEHECTELVFMDRDLKPELHQLGRLLSHDVDIVCAQYAMRGLPTKFHGQELKGETVNEKTALQKMTFAPIGFAKIKTAVFYKLKEVFPEREHCYEELTSKHIGNHEFFPTGLVGPNTPEGKLDRIKGILARRETPFMADLEDIFNVVKDSDYSDSHYYGEDYYFCLLAKKAGFDINLDTALIIPHAGEITFPIMNQDLNAMAKEEWRQAPR